MRSTVDAAEPLWSDDRTRWPVSAAVSAIPMVSGSRISPSRRTSGSSRSASRRPDREVARVAPDLTPPHERCLRRDEGVLDRVLERRQDDGPPAKRLLRERGERRGLARPGRPADEDEPVRDLDQVLERHGEVQRRERGSGRRKQPDGRGQPLGGAKDVQARAAAAGHVDRRVAREALREGLGHGRRQLDRLVSEAAERTVDPHERRLPVRQVQIAGAQREGGRQQTEERGGRGLVGCRRGCRGGRRRGRGSGQRQGRRHVRRRRGKRDSGRRRTGRNGRGAAALAHEDHVEPAGAGGQLHVEPAQTGRLVRALGPSLRLEGLLAVGREDLAEKLAKRVLRRDGDAEPLRRPEREHLRLLVGAEAQLVRALLDQDGEEAVDARHTA